MIRNAQTSEWTAAFGKTLLFALVLPPLILHSTSGSANAQEIKIPVVRTPSASPQRPYPPGIPAAELPCTPEEQKWWDDLRNAGEEVRFRRGGDKARKRFAELLKEGETKSYAPPIKEWRIIFLAKSEPQYTEEARHRKISGTIRLKVEYLANGTVGNVEPLDSLGGGLDENAMASARKMIFLPAIKDRKFINTTLPVVMSFNLY